MSNRTQKSAVRSVCSNLTGSERQTVTLLTGGLTQGNQDAASNSKEHCSKRRVTQKQKEVATAFTQEARISSKRHTKLTRQAGYTLALCLLAFEENGQVSVAVLRNFKSHYTAASTHSSCRGRWENSRPTNLSFGVRKWNCLFGSGLQKLHFSHSSLPLSAFMCLQPPPPLVKWGDSCT